MIGTSGCVAPKKEFQAALDEDGFPVEVYGKATVRECRG